MNISLNKRKFIPIFLFAIILILQFLTVRTWYYQKTYQNNLSESIQNTIKPNQALVYSNFATKNYFEAENHFNYYLQNHNKKSLEKYQNAIQAMTKYLDSLNVLYDKDIDFRKIITTKQGVEKDIIKLRNRLDSLLLSNNFEALQKKAALDFAIKKYDYTKVLSTITYDTIKKTTEVKKKSLFGRIGNALAGKSDVKKEEVQSNIKMVFNNEVKTGSFEDQMKNIFLFSEKYYQNEIFKVRNVYTNLNQKDGKLLQVNGEILSKSQKIISFYSQSAQELAILKFMNTTKAFNINVKNNKITIRNLMLLMGFLTLLLLLYTLYAVNYEKKLAKAKTQAENNLDLLHQLVGVLSHEMRAPLNIISNYTNKLKNDNSNTALAPIINSLHFTSNSLQITVNQILDFFKTESKAFVLYNSKINLKREVTATIESLQSLSEIKNIKLTSNFDSKLDTFVWADNVKIHQLFYNIIGNAIKFTKEGSINIDTKLTEIDTDKLRFDVKIKDTGLGIPKEDQKRIFDKFYQSNTHKEQLSFGAGLGLSLCKEIVELFNGKISVVSEVNQGTEISFYLILEKSIIEQETSKTKLINKFENKTINIALVDDDKMILTIIKKLITELKFNIITFQNAHDIKKYLATQIVDLVITDIQIFDYSGIQLAADIKQLTNNNSTCPIIALTGDSYMSTIDLKTINIDEILIKPINKEEFYQKILKVL